MEDLPKLTGNYINFLKIDFSSYIQDYYANNLLTKEKIDVDRCSSILYNALTRLGTSGLEPIQNVILTVLTSQRKNINRNTSKPQIPNDSCCIFATQKRAFENACGYFHIDPDGITELQDMVEMFVSTVKDNIIAFGEFCYDVDNNRIKYIAKYPATMGIFRLCDRFSCCGEYVMPELRETFENFLKQGSKGNLMKEDFTPFFTNYRRTMHTAGKKIIHFYPLSSEISVCKETYRQIYLVPKNITPKLIPEGCPDSWPKKNSISIKGITTYGENQEQAQYLTVLMWLSTCKYSQVTPPTYVTEILASLNDSKMNLLKFRNSSAKFCADYLSFSKLQTGVLNLSPSNRQTTFLKYPYVLEQAHHVIKKSICNHLRRSSKKAVLMIDKWSTNKEKNSVLAILLKVPHEIDDLTLPEWVHSGVFLWQVSDKKQHIIKKRSVDFGNMISERLRGKWILLDLYTEIGRKSYDVFFALLTTLLRFRLHEIPISFQADRGKVERKALSLLLEHLEGKSTKDTIKFIENKIDSIAWQFTTDEELFCEFFTAHDFYFHMKRLNSTFEDLRNSYLKKMFYNWYQNDCYSTTSAHGLKMYSCAFYMLSNFLRTFFPTLQQTIKVHQRGCVLGKFNKLFDTFFNQFKLRVENFVFLHKDNMFLEDVFELFKKEYCFALEKDGINCSMMVTKKMFKTLMKGGVSNNIVENYSERHFDIAFEALQEDENVMNEFEEWRKSRVVSFTFEDIKDHFKQCFVKLNELYHEGLAFVRSWRHLYGKAMVVFKILFEEAYGKGDAYLRDNSAKAFAICEIFKTIKIFITTEGCDHHNIIRDMFENEEISLLLFFCDVIEGLKAIMTTIEADDYRMVDAGKLIARFVLMLRNKNLIEYVDIETATTIKGECRYKGNMKAYFEDTVPKKVLTRKDEERQPDTDSDNERRMSSGYDHKIGACAECYNDKDFAIEYNYNPPHFSSDTDLETIDRLNRVRNLFNSCLMHCISRCMNEYDFTGTIVSPIPYSFFYIGSKLSNVMKESMLWNSSRVYDVPATTCPVERFFSQASIREMKSGHSSHFSTRVMKMKLHRSLPYILIRDDVSTTVLDEFVDVNRFKWELLQRRRSEKEEEDVDQPPVKLQRKEDFDDFEEDVSDISDS
ncbi:hypothetical protein PCE1_000479 [Barthelona sp. PCE]